MYLKDNCLKMLIIFYVKAPCKYTCIFLPAWILMVNNFIKNIPTAYSQTIIDQLYNVHHIVYTVPL